MWIKCSHPAKSLFVDRDSTAKKRDDEFTEITHHLFCMSCGEKIDIAYSMMNFTVQEFINRGMQKKERENNARS